MTPIHLFIGNAVQYYYVFVLNLSILKLEKINLINVITLYTNDY